ncbi:MULTISPECIES: F0F1 ATP synthase subunit B [unclassified Salinibacterium]|uniref:F0F1 ATP synthase subunit B n=1 Tax=unclassified Salinibacterium TaxID=2632331 RepID=UPI0018CEAAE2|nr:MULTISPECIES: F0F1 ATP synthase subunit B [unclassified Salinibacterium]MBH0055178.1 F0F1 ATP synthase subunit B [Salinibacterium sp. SWN139]MBH0084527.1 F0F1 ATP synthase subunit B [Salinibacterium sp. SWN167]MBH0117809.1 F0F1 ATP synthase subunit B [Salinibacterium sp. NG253]
MLSALLAAAEDTEADVINPLLPADYDIIWSLVCFAIILFFFWKKFLPALTKTLDARAEAIEGGIKKAEIAQAEAAEALEQYKTQLAEGRAEAAKIREQARLEGTEIVNELKEQATVEAARITANAQATIEAERQAALVSLRSEVGSMAIDLASGVIGQSLTDDKKSSALVDQFLADLEASEKAKAKK